MANPREMTTEEVRRDFLDTLRGLIELWAEAKEKTSEEKLWGLTHSILCVIDGVMAGSPAYCLSPNPHTDEIEEAREEDRNWFPPIADERPIVDISGGLHELFYPGKQKRSLG